MGHPNTAKVCGNCKWFAPEPSNQTRCNYPMEQLPLAYQKYRGVAVFADTNAETCPSYTKPTDNDTTT